MSLKVSNLRLDLDDPEQDLPRRLAGRLGLDPSDLLRWRILRKSLDARRHDDLHFMYAMEVDVSPEVARRLSAGSDPDVQPFVPERFDWPAPGDRPLEHRPVIIGAGPAGLLAGYLLAEHGYRPLILERGRAVKDRVADVRRFDSGGPFDPESNYLFGEGGAGTFSDGKLTSRSTGPDVNRILEILADCHGKPSIVYEHRPHLGSNRLPLVVRTLRRKLEDLGGEVRFSCRAEDLDLADGRIRGVCTSSGYIPADVVVLAVGHSARDTYGMLLRRGIPLVAKPFQFGVRIEQPQSQIDEARYGGLSGHPSLGAADYGLSVRAGECDLFTFCMCAGGYVMPSVSEPGYFCTNGMSESRHDSPFANSGLVVTIDPAETGSDHPLAGVHFQQRFERMAYLAAGRSYGAPIQWVRDFFRARASHGKIPSSYSRVQTVPTDLNSILPARICEALVRGLPVMDRRFHGLFLKHATLAGPEARGSSPVRIPRDPATRQSPTVAGLYPCGEGAGFAGGIISAAVDGLRTARAITSIHARPGT
ncbi:NAD(P)/FAD-dependent oxidoreductase [Aquisphaera insulae]|uniref:NAD(P)/FAD-dependent oxidoreductase n=1 Tax=Aquisphaera insulae TaxID=2712864 RepID=UPI0013EA9D39|nr:FAD-dependent oxidoreductase [Aquisphaera insulae]